MMLRSGVRDQVRPACRAGSGKVLGRFRGGSEEGKVRGRLPVRLEEDDGEGGANHRREQVDDKERCVRVRPLSRRHRVSIQRLRRPVSDRTHDSPQALHSDEEQEQREPTAAVGRRVRGAVRGGVRSERDSEGNECTTPPCDAALAETVSACPNRQRDDEIGGARGRFDVADVGVVAQQFVQELDKHRAGPDGVGQALCKDRCPCPSHVAVDGAAEAVEAAGVARL